MGTALAKGASVSSLLLFGTITSLISKTAYELESTGEGGQKKFFHKPWAMTSLMFMGMTFCLPLAYYLESIEKKRRALTQEEVPLLSTEVPKRNSELKECLMLAIPTFFDLLATILMNIGLLYVTASVYQMMRGAEMLFAALFSVVFLGRTLNRFHLLGILCCMTGVSLVGTSSYLSGEGSATQVITPEQNLLGIGLIVLSQAIQAAQLTFEDFFMADLNVPPMKIVGFEGLFGVIGTLGIMAPIAYFLPGEEGEGIHEDIKDTAVMISNSRALQLILGLDMFALLAYNMAGMMVTGSLGAVFRTVLETTRTLFVWLVSLGLFYLPLGVGQLGESWTKYSWMQAAGFAVLVCGTLVYNKGDEEVVRKEAAEALAVQAAQEPYAADDEAGYLPPGLATPPGASEQTMPLLMPGQPAAASVTEPIGISSSFKVRL
uniref:EamA domain-containing protein n=1 Tax=Dunaliella tertiolecta TaxID=3047 RepID=A0A7S3QMG5_DUNTE